MSSLFTRTYHMHHSVHVYHYCCYSQMSPSRNNKIFKFSSSALLCGQQQQIWPISVTPWPSCNRKCMEQRHEEQVIRSPNYIYLQILASSYFKHTFPVTHRSQCNHFVEEFFYGTNISTITYNHAGIFSL